MNQDSDGQASTNPGTVSPTFEQLSRARIYQQTLAHFFAPVAHALYKDNKINEVMINGPDHIYVERSGGRIERLKTRFPTEAALQAAVNNLAEYVNRRIGGDRHSMDARLPEGFRVHVIVPPASRNGIVVTIRKFAQERIAREQLVDVWKTLSESAWQFLNVAIRLKRNVLVSGGTGTGKTTLLNALSECIDADDRVIVIEDSSELKLNQEHTIYLESVPPKADGSGGATIRDLFVDSLRMRPDRILVGEVRRGEALDLVQSMLSGHDGCMSTIHASSPRLALVRLETLCLMSDVKMPVYVARTQVASAIHLVVQIVRHKGHRLVNEISEVRGLENGDQYVTKTLFSRASVRGVANATDLPPLNPTGQICAFAQEVRDEGLDREASECAALFAKPQ